MERLPFGSSRFLLVVPFLPFRARMAAHSHVGNTSSALIKKDFMRTDPASQARTSTRFTIIRALVAALVLAGLAALPAVCRGADMEGYRTMTPPNFCPAS